MERLQTELSPAVKHMEWGKKDRTTEGNSRKGGVGKRRIIKNKYLLRLYADS